MTFAAPPLQSRSELLDASFVLAKRHFFRILRAALPAIVLAVVVDLVIEVVGQDANAALLAIPTSLLVWGVAEGMALAACWNLVHGNPLTPASGWQLVGGRLWAVAFGYAFKWMLITVGLVIFIVPGVYLIARWFAVPMASVAEHATLRQAYDRSSRLSELELGRLIWTLGMLELGLMVVGIGLGGLAAIGNAEASVAGLETVVYWGVGIAVLPLRVALTTLLYLDIRMRREAYDLQAGLQRLSSSA